MIAWKLVIDYTDNHYLYGNELVVYHELTGETHLFVELVHDIFKIISVNQLSTMQITQELSKNTGIDNNMELLDYVETFMHTLVKLNFVNQVKECD